MSIEITAISSKTIQCDEAKALIVISNKVKYCCRRRCDQSEFEQLARIVPISRLCVFDFEPFLLFISRRIAVHRLKS